LFARRATKLPSRKPALPMTACTVVTQMEGRTKLRGISGRKKPQNEPIMTTSTTRALMTAAELCTQRCTP
jgi:hypothetical protein